MKQMYVPYIEGLNNIAVEAAGDLLDESGTRGTIEILNWPELYAYRPITIFTTGRSLDSMFIKFNVRGSMLKAVYTNDQDPVYKDSCVEFFCKMPESDKYMNFEFNCIGTASAASRKGRDENVNPLSKEQMETIKRFSSLGRRAFKEMEGMFEWDLTVQIPFALMGIDPANFPEKILGNFYKCADDTDSPHFVTWSPVKTEKPDFHRPEFFGELILK